jgi:hypothetical protein
MTYFAMAPVTAFHLALTRFAYPPIMNSQEILYPRVNRVGFTATPFELLRSHLPQSPYLARARHGVNYDRRRICDLDCP